MSVKLGRPGRPRHRVWVIRCPSLRDRWASSRGFVRAATVSALATETSQRGHRGVASACSRSVDQRRWVRDVRRRPGSKVRAEWVVITSFENRHAAEYMLASLGHEFRQMLARGMRTLSWSTAMATACPSARNHGCSKAGGFAATTARGSVGRLFDQRDRPVEQVREIVPVDVRDGDVPEDAADEEPRLVRMRADLISGVHQSGGNARAARCSSEADPPLYWYSISLRRCPPPFGGSPWAA
jgi:hypothetical protein